jgi:hypothetical protein
MLGYARLGYRSHSLVGAFPGKLFGDPGHFVGSFGDGLGTRDLEYISKLKFRKLFKNRWHIFVHEIQLVYRIIFLYFGKRYFLTQIDLKTNPISFY